MSKNFELLQQAELNSGPAPSAGAPHTHPTGSAPRPTSAPRVTPLRPSSDYMGNALRRGSGASDRMDLDRLTEEESLRLVQSLFLANPDGPRVVMFAGVDSGNGCSHVCAQAAESLANNVRGSVCLVDGNLRTPTLPEYFGVTNHHGLTDSLRSSGAIREFAKKLLPENLWLLSCGSLAGDSSTLINSSLMKARISELRQEFDYVLIDSPPLNTYSDGVVLGQLSDGLVLVLEANATRREAALKITDGLRSAKIKILGAVLNKRTFPIPDYWYHKL
jgi:capsular exopolysaccharide synthesis family protein